MNYTSQMRAKIHQFQLKNIFGIESQVPEKDEMNKAATKEQNMKMRKVFSEFHAGTLKTSAGDIVTNHKQAVAIALSEAGIKKSVEADDDNAYIQSLVAFESIQKLPQYQALNHIYNRRLTTSDFLKGFSSTFEKGGFGSGRHRMSMLAENKKQNVSIGKTKSGKDVYSHSNAMDYTDFTVQDHKDAIRHHMREHDDPKNDDITGNKKRHLVIAQTHAKAAGILN